MTWDPWATSDAQDRALDDALDAARRAGSDGVAVFDLDGCLFDNRPRQVQIVREYAERIGHRQLARIAPEHFQSWVLGQTMVRLGLPEAEARALHRPLFAFWRERFFDDAYVRHDVPLPGARDFVQAIADTGCRVVYLTGRYATMRTETARSLRRWRFPWPAVLLLKANADEDDPDYKLRAMRQIGEWGRVVLSADNEPSQITNMQRAHPQAVSLWLDTDHSPKAVAPKPPVRAMKGFLRSE